MTLFNALKNRYIIADFSNKEYVDVKITSPGHNPINKIISIEKWDEYLQEKINSGYTEEKTIEVKNTKRNLHPDLQKLIDISRQIVESSYKLSVVPSKEAITEVKDLLIQLTKTKDLTSFNEILFKIFSKIPRKMKNPILETAKNNDDFTAIIQRESDLIENLNSYQADDAELNFSFTECSEDEINEIKKRLGHISYRFVSAYRVNNFISEKNYTKYCKSNNIQKTSLLWHGSKNQNWYSIMQMGLSINPVNVDITGKMFGNGIYFAPSADKSRGYTSLGDAKWTSESEKEGFLALYEVATGNEYRTPKHNLNDCLLTEEKFKKNYPGYDSYHALEGVILRADEVVVYNNDACNIKYLVKIK